MKYILITLGFLFIALGIIGIILPLMPATPFLILATACFLKGSEKFHTWFLTTNLYKKYVYGVKMRQMTIKAKISALISVTAVMTISFFVMHNWYGRSLLIIILLFHYYYFFFRIKTIHEKKEDETSHDE